MTGRGPRVAAYGYFGMGNIGNEGTLAAFLAYLRSEHPHAALACFAARPEVVEHQHGVRSRRLMTYFADPSDHGRRATVTKAVSRLWDVPRSFAMMRDVDVLVVPGTGVLETKLLARPWGLPYWMFLAVLSARMRGCKVALVSVGAEQAAHPVTRWLYRSTVRLSHYCSYRDEESRDAMRAMGADDAGPVFPDLAFSLPVPDGLPERPGHVVIGVMSYSGSPDDPDRGEGVVDAYVTGISEVITRLLDQGRSVTTVVGDVADFGLAARIEADVRTARLGLPPGQLSVSPAQTLEEIMAEMSAAEVVVASRFHNLICALMLCKPTVSLGYAGKSDRLMDEFGLGEFTQPMDSFDPNLLIDQIAEVRRVQPQAQAQMKETLHRFEDELGEQFRRLSGVVLERS